MPEERIYQLAVLFFQGKISEAESAELAGWINRSEDEATLAELLGKAWEAYKPTDAVIALANSRLEGLPDNILTGYPLQNQLEGSSMQENTEEAGKVKNGFFRRSWMRAAAIFLLLALGATAYFIFSGNSHEQKKTLGEQQLHDLPPGGNKATLTLADGSVIVLDSAGNGSLAAQGGVRIVKQDGVVTYVFENTASPESDEVYYNTIATPRGGEYHIVLPDGSEVWLNAASSITFPTRFAKTERRVKMTGEAYLEVNSRYQTPEANGATASRAPEKVPFVVEIDAAPFGDGFEKAEVRVLGTHFNINAYTNEAAVKTTLMEGKVTVGLGAPSANTVVLVPGEQALLKKGGRLSVDKEVDLEEVMAWKNGMFYFSNADIQTVMRQISRWYNIDVVYAGTIPNERFEGTIPRNSNVSDVFRILELSNLHVKLEGRTATVLP